MPCLVTLFIIIHGLKIFWFIACPFILFAYATLTVGYRLASLLAICCMCRLGHYFSHSLSLLQFSPFLLLTWSSSAFLAATNDNLDWCSLLPLHCIFALIHSIAILNIDLQTCCLLSVLMKRNLRKKIPRTWPRRPQWWLRHCTHTRRFSTHRFKIMHILATRQKVTNYSPNNCMNAWSIDVWHCKQETALLLSSLI